MLTINAGIISLDASGLPVVTSGSWFACDCNGNSNDNGVISANERNALQQGTEGIIIGTLQGIGTANHSGPPLATDWNRIIAPYAFLYTSAQEYTTTAITGSTEFGLDLSGLRWQWNGVDDISFGSGAWGAGFTNGIANFSWDGISGHSYTLDYRTTVPAGDPSGLQGLPFAYHLEGTVNSVPLPASAWLFGSGLLGLFSISRQKNTCSQI